MRAKFSLILTMVLLVAAPRSFAAPQNTIDAQQENTTREFVMACTYGVLAGTLVGAASLAFTSRPGQNLGTVARGASIGLYVGILLGLYVVYIVPGLEESGDEEPVARLDRIPFMLSPTFAGLKGDQLKMDGLKADWTVLRF